VWNASTRAFAVSAPCVASRSAAHVAVRSMVDVHGHGPLVEALTIASIGMHETAVVSMQVRCIETRTGCKVNVILEGH